MRTIASILSTGILSVALMSPALADDATAPTMSSSSATTTDAPTKADIRNKNSVHNGKNAVSAEEKNDKPADRELTRKIRRSITNYKSLSTDAHNIKISSKDGGVVLTGYVKNVKEKEKIESAAAKIAGKDMVNSQLEVKF